MTAGFASLVVFVAAVGGCGSTPAQPPPTAGSGPPARNAPEPTRARADGEREDVPAPSGCCSDAAQLEAAYGERVQVVGRYEIVPIHAKGARGEPIARWPAVVLADGTKVLLESFWEHEQGRSPDEREPLVGRRVVVTGVLRAAPPRKGGAQNLMVPTMAPVETIRLADE